MKKYAFTVADKVAGFNEPFFILPLDGSQDTAVKLAIRNVKDFFKSGVSAPIEDLAVVLVATYETEDGSFDNSVAQVICDVVDVIGDNDE